MSDELKELAGSPEAQAALAERVCQGDSSAEEALVRWYGPRVLLMMLARTRQPETARDLSQDVLIAVVSALRTGQLREATRLSAFVHGIARNTVNNFLRTRRREPPLDALPEMMAATDGRDPVEALERRDLIGRALNEISDDDREVLTLTLIDGLKPGEIARQLGLKDEVVRTRKSRALKRVIECVQRLSRK